MPETPVTGAIAVPEPAAAITTAAPALSPTEIRQNDLLAEYDFDVPEPTPLTKQPPAGVTVATRGTPGVVSESPPPAVSPPKHSRRALQMAADFGIHQSEIDAATPEELDSLVYHLNRQLLADRELTRQNTPRDLPKQQPVVQTPPPEDEIDWGEHDLDGTGTKVKVADKDVFGPVAQVLKRQAKQIKELQAAMNGIYQREIVRENETTADKLDHFFNSKDQAHFGRGKGREMGNTTEYRKRLAVINEARMLAGENASKEQALAKMDEAAANLGWSAAAAPLATPPVVPSVSKPVPSRDPANGRFTEQQQRWMDAGVSRPTHRDNAEEPKGMARAVRSLEEKMNAVGEATSSTALDAELESELPD